MPLCYSRPGNLLQSPFSSWQASRKRITQRDDGSFTAAGNQVAEPLGKRFDDLTLGIKDLKSSLQFLRSRNRSQTHKSELRPETRAWARSSQRDLSGLVWKQATCPTLRKPFSQPPKSHSTKTDFANCRRRFLAASRCSSYDLSGKILAMKALAEMWGEPHR